MAPARRRLRANLRYLKALAKRFRITLALAAALLFVMPLIFVWLYRGPSDERITYGQALTHVYFLFYGQPTLPYSPQPAITLLNFVIPPLAIAVLADGVVRFAYLFFAKHRSDKEWIEVISQTLSNHVVICGAGRVGFRVAQQLLALKENVVVVEKREDAPFITVLRDQHVPVLIDDVRSSSCLPRTNIKQAAAIVCATDDDLANLNIALDARKENPNIRVVIRLFDDDLVAKVKDAFRAEALSSSALAAPAMALASLDPRIVHSFQVGGHLMVVSEFLATHGLPGMRISRLRDAFGGLTLAMRREGQPEIVHPKGELEISAGDVLTVQAEYRDYLKLREFTGESPPPSWVPHPG